MRQRIVLLTRPTAKQNFVSRFGTEGQMKFLLSQSFRGKVDLEVAEDQDSAQSVAVSRIRRAVPSDIKLVEIDRGMVAQFLFEPHDLVVAVGQDGLVANVAKYLDGQPLAGVNPDPSHIDGALLAFTVSTFVEALPAMLRDGRSFREATLAETVTSDQQTLLGFNEIFVGVPSHQSARYRIRHGKQEEVQSSSGLIVSTGSGSTGWLRSLRGDEGAFDPAAEELRFVVREAWPGRGYGATLVEGVVTAGEQLFIESRMDGVIFADGIEDDAIRFDAGITASFAPSLRRARLLV